MIYFMRDARRVKIGYSEKPEQRRQQMSTAIPGLAIIGIEPGGRPRERELHERFRNLNIGGEWFKYAPELARYIDENCPVAPRVDGRSKRATGRTAQLNLKVRPEWKAQLVEMAEARGMLIAELIEYAFAEWKGKQ